MHTNAVVYIHMCWLVNSYSCDLLADWGRAEGLLEVISVLQLLSQYSMKIYRLGKELHRHPYWKPKLNLCLSLLQFSMRRGKGVWGKEFQNWKHCEIATAWVRWHPLWAPGESSTPQGLSCRLWRWRGWEEKTKSLVFQSLVFQSSLVLPSFVGLSSLL